MALLSLQNIGKIYVSEGNVAVGIRGVNLDFDRGEFVAVTGESGSGKSTLLNVISGMDAYEEGEMLVESEPTSHYLEADREKYREKYLSFIFQDYNILESFTVLQNVELALGSIEDKRERRKRAVELLNRVGLGKQLHQKGSKLSGGQKQRTVIARALAKDSPIILADEPTGNLDSASSKEIIELLREVSRDKLLIVVTHDFDEVAPYATREVRVFDGAVVSDHRLRPAEDLSAEPLKTCGDSTKHPVKNGFALGRAMFAAMPKLSLFMCFLFLIGSLGLFAVTGICGEIPQLLGRKTTFTHETGRVILTRDDGSVLEEGETERLAKETGAERYLRYDWLCDLKMDSGPVDTYVVGNGADYAIYAEYGKDYGSPAVGRYPEAEDECFLYLSVSLQPVFGKNELLSDHIVWQKMNLKIVGVRYFYDNNLKNRMVLTEKGYANAAAAALINQCNQTLTAGFLKNGQAMDTNTVSRLFLSYEMPEGKAYVSSENFRAGLTGAEDKGRSPMVYLEMTDRSGTSSRSFSRLVASEDILKTAPADFDAYLRDPLITDYVAINPNTLRETVEEVWKKEYRQASLFFADDKAAAAAADSLRTRGYIAVSSDTTYTPSVLETILNTLSGLFLAVLWVLIVIFLAFFIRICSGKAIDAVKRDLAILRSMGIPVKTVALGLYGRVCLALLPAVLITLGAAFLVFRSPKLNGQFTYLYWWQYLLMILGLFFIATRVARKQMKRLFGESVRVSLRGGDNE